MIFNLTQLYLFLNFKIAKPFNNSKFKPLKILGKIIHHLLVFIWKCDIDVNARIGKKVNFPHFIGIVIGPSKIGDNCTIRQNVTIGRKNINSKKYPQIGNNVEIGANSVIIGEITIEDNVIIGASSFINKSIPKNSVVYNERKIIIKNIK